MANQTLDLGESLLGKLLNSRNAFRNIYDLSGGYGKATQIVTLLNEGGSVKVNTADAKYEKFTIGHQGVIAKIDTRAVSGVNLILTLIDPLFDFFRNGDVVLDIDRAQGFVLSHAPGTITISPYDRDVFLATDFESGDFARRGWNSSSNRNSTGTESLYATPDTIVNFGSIKRDSVFLHRRDFHETFIDEAISKKNWALMQEHVLINRVMQSMEWSHLFEERNQKIINGELTNSNGGLLWAIKNRGGTHIVSPNDLTEETWQGLIETVSKKDATSSSRLTFLYGKAALSRIQSFTSDFVKQSGINNTFGGTEVSGIDVQTYAYLGTIIDFVYLPILDDETMFPEQSTITGKQRMSSAFFLVDFSSVMGHEGEEIPAIERFHFDIEGMRYGYIPGTIGPDGGNPSDHLNMGKFLMVSDIDGVSAHLTSDGGIDIANARKMLFFELVS